MWVSRARPRSPHRASPAPPNHRPRATALRPTKPRTVPTQESQRPDPTPARDAQAYPLTSAKPLVSVVLPMSRPFSRAPLVSRVPLPVRRAALLLGVIAAVVGRPCTALAAARPAAPVTQAAGALVAPARAAAAGTPAQVSQPGGPAGVTGLAGPAAPGAPGGVCQVPGIGDIGGLLGFCAAGSSGLVGDFNNICQPSVPAPEPATGGIDALIRPPDTTVKQPATLYDSYGVAGQSWAAFDLQCSDMTSLIGNNVAGVVFDAAKALDRVTITVYQSAAGEGILSWLSGAVDK